MLLRLAADFGSREQRWNRSLGGWTNINLQIINELALPLPLLVEQAVIVERVEALMRTCRALEAEIERARSHAAHLLQAVLKETFNPA